MLTKLKFIRPNLLKIPSYFRYSKNKTQIEDEVFVEEEESNNYSNYYQPHNKINFIDGKHLLFNYDQFSQTRSFLLIVSGIFGVVGFWALNKIYHYDQRGILGYIFYPLIAYSCISRLYKYQNTFQSLIKQVYLKDCGTKIQVIHPRSFYGSVQTEVDISTITKPEGVESTEQTLNRLFAFPIVFQNRIYYLSNDVRNIKNQELLPVIMNGQYINLTNNVEREYTI